MGRDEGWDDEKLGAGERCVIILKGKMWGGKEVVFGGVGWVVGLLWYFGHVNR